MMGKLTSSELKDALDDDGYLLLALREPLRESIKTFYFKKYGSHAHPDTVEELLDKVTVNYSVDNL